MFKLLRTAGWVGGLAALARSPMGQRVTAKAMAYVKDPENRRKLGELRSKAMGSRAS